MESDTQMHILYSTLQCQVSLCLYVVYPLDCDLKLFHHDHKFM